LTEAPGWRTIQAGEGQGEDVKSARRSPNRGDAPGSVAAPILLAALISALSLFPASAALAQSGEAELIEGDGGGPGSPGQDGADSAGGGSGESGTDSQGADGVSRKGLSVRGTGIVEEVTAEEAPAPSTPTQQAPARPRAAARNVTPVRQPTADLVPGPPPAPIGSGPPEALPAPQPALRAEPTAEEPLLAWVLLFAGGLLAIALIVGSRRGTGRPGRRSLRDATA
jgi:hypothetical protein